MKLRTLLSSFIILPVLLSSAYAEEFSMNQVSSLQSEYQAQLNKKPRVRKAPTRAKQNNANRASLQQAAQLLLGNRQTRRQYTKPQPVRQQRRPVRQTHSQPHQYQRPAPVRRQAIPQHPQKIVPQADSLFTAASSGNVGAIARLINQGINVNIANRERETALHMAAAKGHYQAAIYLINHGANIHARTVNNWLPIHHATRFRHANIANYLLQRGSSPYARTSDGLSAIDMAKATHDRRLLSLYGVK